jgi:hypothetical protein
MEKRVGLFMLLMTLFITLSCSSGKLLSDQQAVILPLSDVTTLKEGSIVYGLPRTVFTVNVEMERIIEKPGPYARYAADLLGLTDAIQSETELWSLMGMTVKTDEEPDPSEFYVIESNTLFQTNVLSLKKSGLILDLNPNDLASDVLRADINGFDSRELTFTDLGSDEYFRVQRDTAFRRISVDTAFIRIPYIVEKKKMLTPDQLAERAARRLMEMRDGKHMILTGETNVFPQNEAAINEMNRLEKEYTELFTGKTWKEKRTYSYQIIPVREQANEPIVLFRFSELTGPVAAAESAGTPVNIEFIPEQKLKDLSLIVKPEPESDVPVYDKLYYRVPDMVNVKISSGSDDLYSSRRLIFQFGRVIQLPANYIIGQ